MFKKTIFVLICVLFSSLFNYNHITIAKSKSELENELAQLEQKVKNNESTIEDYNQKIKETQAKIDDLNNQIALIVQDKIKNEEKKMTLEENLKTIVINSQGVDVNSVNIELLFGSKNQDEILSRTSSIQQINDYTNSALEEISSLQKILKDQEATLIAKTTEQTQLSASMNESIKNLIAENKVNEATISTISSENKCILKPELPECQPPPPPPIFVNQVPNSQASSNSSPTAPQPGKLFLKPAGSFTQSFGCANWERAYIYPRLNGCYWHNGEDYAQSFSSGSPIVAARYGTVVVASFSSSWGNQVILKHDIDGTTWYTQYAHLSRILVKPGQSVNTGDLIGLEGGTPSFAVHLHFSVYINSYDYFNAVNPRDYY